MNITQQDVDQLAARLQTIDLTQDDQAVLNLLIDQAEGEVVGFAAIGDMGLSFKSLKGGQCLKLGDPDSKNRFNSEVSLGTKNKCYCDWCR